MNMPLSEEQKEQLSAPLSTANVKSRKGGRGQLAYVEAWHCIDMMNKIFGFTQWSSELLLLDQVANVHLDGEGKSAKFNISYLAKVQVTINGATYADTGTGHGLNMTLGDAIESASKEAVSDAMKRAMRHLGYQFGLALYDKEFANVIREEDVKQTSRESAPKSTGGAESTTGERQPVPDDSLEFPPSGNTKPDPPKKGIAAFIAACQEQKWRLGPVTYRFVLRSFGFEKSNQIFDKESQLKVFNEFSNLPSLPFLDHIKQLREMYGEAGRENEWTAWWAVFPSKADEVERELQDVVIQELHKQFSANPARTVK